MSFIPPPIPAAGVQAPSLVSANVNCRKCGYNLRGLSTDGRCPECGTAVAYSVKGDFIRYSDPEWVLRLRSGAINILIGIGIYILGIISLIVLGAMAGARGGGKEILGLLGPLIGLVAQGLIIFGTWQLTTPDPSGLGEDQYGTIRKFIRMALLIGVGSTLLQLFAASAPLSGPIVSMLVVLQSVCQLIGIIGFCCQLVYLSRITMRLPDEAMSRRAKSLAWTIGVAYGVVFLALVLLVVLGTGTRAAGPLAALGCAAGLFGLAVIIGGILYLLLLEKFARRLLAEAQMARETWARLPSPA